MRVTVIPIDKTIGVDGRFLRFAFSAAPGIHAIQWYGDHGELEYVGHKTPNRLLTEADYAAAVKPYVDAWEAEAARVEQEAEGETHAPD
jgi:hypothetical protein